MNVYLCLAKISVRVTWVALKHICRNVMPREWVQVGQVKMLKFDEKATTYSKEAGADFKDKLLTYM